MTVGDGGQGRLEMGDWLDAVDLAGFDRLCAVVQDAAFVAAADE